ncbi:ABC-type transport system involved in multi-copper enzyme maturation permease subunit [Actinoalloteichus hoggarensis]|uniref:ABC-2 family transporter protein n=1 Tax=Actinoalloteichus hoggarensis TaxID=1470176 RepID=A0A221VZZ3_9PSEU|nr:ABC transporter permease [Actinoalloteichus hoggarensis]ASO19083.1 ABC-2 family transporter protein [Actinoalloteichus hoggarensis]MBB5920321.1 ABC-type transport system involved in multi-copper enzyme maturation permease subunit [Actinoalloteichus hoggarensis]
MIGLLHAEFHRITSTRLWIWAVLAALACGGLTGLIAVIGPQNATPPLPGLDTAEGARVLLGLAGLTTFVPALFGTTAMGSEHRHRTITTTFLFAPRRWRVLVAKIVVHAVAGLCYGALVAATAVGGLAAGAALHGVEPGLSSAELVGSGLRIVVAMAVFAVLGVAVGALVDNQIVALAVVGIWFYAVENLLLFVPGAGVAYPYLPGGATSSLLGFTLLAEQAADIAGTGIRMLSAPAAALLLLGYLLIATAAAIARPLRRDVV